jgi:hypothetical protein
LFRRRSASRLARRLRLAHEAHGDLASGRRRGKAYRRHRSAQGDEGRDMQRERDAEADRLPAQLGTWQGAGHGLAHIRSRLW